MTALPHNLLLGMAAFGLFCLLAVVGVGLMFFVENLTRRYK